ncbi:helix-turn-helix domain-containing protein [Scytonema sp. UIC 10036]|nr:helix-turn-helix domain-containing protein [Scytonema sp. UIC 10036]
MRLTPEKELGEQLYLRRRRLRLTQQELADAVNIKGRCQLTRQRISHIEQGSEPSWFEGVTLAKAIGCDITELVG